MFPNENLSFPGSKSLCLKCVKTMRPNDLSACVRIELASSASCCQGNAQKLVLQSVENIELLDILCRTLKTFFLGNKARVFFPKMFTSKSNICQ